MEIEVRFDRVSIMAIQKRKSLADQKAGRRILHGGIIKKV